MYATRKIVNRNDETILSVYIFLIYSTCLLAMSKFNNFDNVINKI